MNFKKFVLKIVRVIISVTWLNWKVFDFDNVLIDEKLHENILICDISYNTLIGLRALRIRFDKIDAFFRIYDGNRYLALFGPEKYDAIHNKIRYLISLKGSIAYVFSNYYAEIKLDSYNSLPIEKTLTLHNVIILINSVIDKKQNRYYYNIFLEKCSYQLAKK